MDTKRVVDVSAGVFGIGIPIGLFVGTLLGPSPITVSEIIEGLVSCAGIAILGVLLGPQVVLFVMKRILHMPLADYDEV